MGGDRAPGEIVAGARQAAAAGHPVVLVGPPTSTGRGDLPLIAASEVIAMDEDPASGVRRKKDSTLVRAAEAVRDGKAVGDDLGRQHRRHDGRRRCCAWAASRASAARPSPRRSRCPARRPTVLLDAGANAEVQPEWLVQFAQMGSRLRPPPLRPGRAEGRPAVDRRGARQGRHAAQGGVRAAGGGARHRLHRQRRGPRHHDRRRRRRRHRRLHRQRRAEDARGRREDDRQGPARRR